MENKHLIWAGHGRCCPEVALFDSFPPNPAQLEIHHVTGGPNISNVPSNKTIQ